MIFLSVWEYIRLVLVNHVVHLVVPLTLEVFEVLILIQVSLAIPELLDLHGIDLLLKHLTRVQEGLHTVIFVAMCRQSLG